MLNVLRSTLVNFLFRCTFVGLFSIDLLLALRGHNCKSNFAAYHPSPLEAKWIENVAIWQDDVCGHTPDSDKHTWLNGVRSYLNNDFPAYFETLDFPLPQIDPWNNSLSVLTHVRSCTELSTNKQDIRYVHTPIEPTASIVRDPRKCWEQMTEKYTQSKAFLAPMSLQGFIHATGRAPKRCFLFDAGATVAFTESGKNMDPRIELNNWSGTDWIYEWYKRVGIEFDEVHAWEPTGRGRRFRRGVKNKKFGENVRVRDGVIHGETESFKHAVRLGMHIPDGVLHFYNVGVTSKIDSKNNPLSLIRQLCKVEDFVVFKLDIDSRFEINIVHQLLEDPETMQLIDDFFYEHHVRNRVMRMHSLDASADPTYQLKYWYNLSMFARERGLRMHFWP